MKKKIFIVSLVVALLVGANLFVFQSDAALLTPNKPGGLLSPTNTGNWLGTWFGYNTSDFLASSTTPSPWSRNSSSGYIYQTTSTDKVGIGITNPTSKLYVYGDVDDWSSTEPFVTFFNGEGSDNQGNVLLLRGGGLSANSYVLKTLDYSGNTDFIILGDGNVGIGTSTPATILHVIGTSTFDNLTINGASGKVVFPNGSNIVGTSTYINIAADASTYFQLRTSDASAIYRAHLIPNNDVMWGLGTSTTRWRTLYTTNITDNGSNVGIGTAPAVGYSLKTLSNISMGSGTFLDYGAGNARIAESSFNLLFQTYTGSALTEKMRITSLGYVVVGTSTATALFDVFAASAMPGTSGSANTGSFRVGNSGSGVVLDQGISGSVGVSWIQSRSNTSYATNYPLLLNPNGSTIGIGLTVAPSSTLHVAGNISLTGSSTVVTASLGGSALLAGACSSATSTIDSTVTSSTAAFITTPTNDPGDGFFWHTIFQSSGVAKTRVCASVAGTPTATTYVVKIIK